MLGATSVPRLSLLACLGKRLNEVTVPFGLMSTYLPPLLPAFLFVLEFPLSISKTGVPFSSSLYLPIRPAAGGKGLKGGTSSAPLRNGNCTLSVSYV